MPTVGWLAVATLLINVPFGFWRAGLPRYGVAWFVAVHAPVPLIVALRIYGELGFRWWTFPLTIAAYFTGQLLGGRLRMRFAAPRGRFPKGPFGDGLF